MNNVIKEGYVPPFQLLSNLIMKQITEKQYREMMENKFNYAKLILRSHGENCLCWECEKSEKDIEHYNQYITNKPYKIINC